MGSEETDDLMNCSSVNESPGSSFKSSRAEDSSSHRDAAISVNASEQPNDMMIVDDIDPAPTNTQKSGKLETKDDSLKPQDPKGVDPKSHGKGVKKGNASPQKEGRKKRLALLSSPDKILQDVLSKSQFKVPNLSQLVEEKFNAPDFQLDLANELKDITYRDTTLHVPNIDQSVLPTEIEFTHTVSVSPSAITLLQCMHELPKKRERYRKGKKKGHQTTKNGGGGGGGASNGTSRQDQRHRNQRNHPGHPGHQNHQNHQNPQNHQSPQTHENRQGRNWPRRPRRNIWTPKNKSHNSSNKDD